MINYDLTVLIPTYNRVDMLVDSIASIQRQTFKPTSIVVYDDGSTDDTPARIKRIASIDSRIQYIRGSANRGVAFARSELLKSCTTGLAAWQDSDDLSHPDRLRRQVNALDGSPFALCLCAGARFKCKQPAMTGEITFPINVANASAMWRTSHQPTIDLKLSIAGEDSDWLKRFCMRPLVIPESLYLIRDHEDRIGVWKRYRQKNPEWIERMTREAASHDQ